MLKSKTILILVLAISLVMVMFSFGFAAEKQFLATATGDWEDSFFGDVGGNDKITEENYEITENEDGTVTMRVSNNRGKIASSTEGLAYYFKELPADLNFEMSATATVESFEINNQVSFGLMLRDEVLINEYNKDTFGNSLAVGPINVKKDMPKISFNRTKSGLVKQDDMINEVVPGPGSVYDLSIKKSGNIFILTFGNEEPVVLENFVFEGDKLYAGLYAVRNTTVVFSDFDIKVEIRKVNELKVDTSLMKTEYLLGESLDLTGLKVTAVYADGSEEILTQDDYIITGFDSNEAGINTISINFNGVTKTIDLTINSLTCTGLEIKYFPAKSDYYIGDQFDPEGLVVIADYNDGYKAEELTSELYTLSISGEDVSDYVFDTSGTKSVTVISTETPETSIAFDVEVSDAVLTGLEIIKLPKVTLYYLGDELDLDGMIIYASYSDGNEARLMKDEYTVSALDTNNPGGKEVIISHKGKTAVLTLTVKEKEFVGIEITNYSKTTYYTGEAFGIAGLEVSKVYDNLDKEVLTKNDYTVDSSAFNGSEVGTYDIVIVPNDTSIDPIVYKVTVREQTEFEWNFRFFGQSSSSSKNFCEEREDGTIWLQALEGGGKVTGDHDGISFYYTEIDAAKDNFVLSADIKVVEYAKKPHDGQESFGIMARDAINKHGDSSVFASNIVAIGGYSGRTTNPNGTQVFIRTGIESSDGAGSQGIQSIMLKDEKPVTKNTYPAADYRLTLAKTNSGFTGQLNDGEEVIFFEPEILNVQDSKIYVGFYTARLATIEVSNIEFNVTAAKTDAPQIEPPVEAVTPEFEFLSLDKVSKTEYDLMVRSNVKGTVTVKQDQEVIAQEVEVEAGKILVIPTTIGANSDNGFSITFLPEDTQYLTSYDKIVNNYTVTMKTFVEDGDIYVSPAGTSEGNGSEENPLDIDTAIDFVKESQKIIVLNGHYVRNSNIEIRKYNDGTVDAMKYLVAGEGAKPVFDFDKRTEGVILSGDYWHVKGIDFTRTAGNTKGFVVGGSYNIIERCRFFENGDTGLQISRTDITENDKSKWPSNNLILHNISFDNHDPSENNADGFAAKLTSGVGNVFRGNIAHNNIDDGWDLYTKAGTGAIGAVILDGNISFNNGFLTDGTVGSGDKNGFKLGGEGIHVPHIIRNSIAFGNGAIGFTSNSNPGVIAENNISFNNDGGNLVFTTYSNITPDFTIDGFYSYQQESTAKDNYPADLSSDSNYFFNGTHSENKSGKQLNYDDLMKMVLEMVLELIETIL